MNTRKLYLISGGILVLIVAVLLYNKSRMEAMSQSDYDKAIPVSVATVGRLKLGGVESLTGTVTPSNDVAILSETEGRVVAVRARIGDRVAAGQVIVQVDDELKEAALRTAQANAEQAKRNLDRFETLHAQNAVTDDQYENAKVSSTSAEGQFIVARRQFNDTKIKSPIEGIVTARPVDVGTLVQSKMFVANVVDISRLKVRLNVAERDVFRLSVGQPVAVTTDIYPGVSFPGEIATIGSKADEAHTYPIEVSLKNSSEHPLKAGMFSRVEFSGSGGREALGIPRAALVGSVKQPRVFVVEQGMAKLRDIVVGDGSGNDLRVISGLREGETIVLNGQNNLRDNVPVAVVK